MDKPLYLHRVDFSDGERPTLLVADDWVNDGGLLTFFKEDLLVKAYPLWRVKSLWIDYASEDQAREYNRQGRAILAAKLEERDGRDPDDPRLEPPA
jgi:hypothetical protein